MIKKFKDSMQLDNKFEIHVKETLIELNNSSS